MKVLFTAIAALGACALFAATTTTTTVTTTTTENGTKRTTTTVTTTDDKDPKRPPKTLTPEQGGYTYVKYHDVRYPYWKGYYYIDRAWVWRGPGKPAVAPPQFLPVMPPPPGSADYTYVDYEGEIVPYYSGYYYIGGVWVWRRPGRPPFPPPNFRPGPPPPRPFPPKPVPPKPGPPRPAPVGPGPVTPGPVGPGHRHSDPAPHHGAPASHHGAPGHRR